MIIESDDGLPIDINNIDIDVVTNLIKYVDIRLLSPIQDVEINISMKNGHEINISYKYNNNYIVSIYIYSAYILIYRNNTYTMMYEGDGEKLNIRERLFSMIMNILINRTRGI